MPKEVVARDVYEVSVRWSAEGSNVQVVLEPNASHIPSGAAYSPSLSRRNINQMIRVLRKARDQVFGADA